MSFSDPTPEARFSKLFYEPTVQELFRMHEWNFATAQTQLSENSIPPDFNWKRSYALPSDFSRLLIFNSFPAFSPDSIYQIMGRNILTNESLARITYIKDITDPSDFDPLFTESLALRIATKLARPLAGSLDMENSIQADFVLQLAEARRIDASSSTKGREKPLWVNSALVRSRMSGV